MDTKTFLDELRAAPPEVQQAVAAINAKIQAELDALVARNKELCQLAVDHPFLATVALAGPETLFDEQLPTDPDASLEVLRMMAGTHEPPNP